MRKSPGSLSELSVTGITDFVSKLPQFSPRHQRTSSYVQVPSAPEKKRQNELFMCHLKYWYKKVGVHIMNTCYDTQ